MRLARQMAASFPLERKLPLLMGALLFAVVGSFGWLAQRELTRTFESVAGERLTVAAQRLASMLSESAGALRADARRTASDSATLAVITTPNASTQSAATRLLLGAVRANSPSRALWTLDCRQVLATGPLKAAPALTQCPVGEPRGESITPLVVLDSGLHFTIVTPVVRAPADTLGYLVQLRRLVTGAGGSLLGNLIGQDVSVRIGNQSGPVAWTDLTRIVPGPPRPFAHGTPTRYVPAEGGEQLGVGVPIANTPWAVWVQMPYATAVAAQSRTLARLAVIALSCILLGVLGAWVLSSHVTAPILELTHATKDFAAGDYTRRVMSSRNDELGVLLASFNTMAEQVQQSTEELAVQTEELEERYREAQELTQELELSNQERSEALEEMKIAHHEKALAQQLLDEVMSQAPVGIAVLDDDLRFIRLNAAMATLHGLPMLEHVARTPAELRPAVEIIDEAALRRVLATGETIANQPFVAMVGGAKRHWLVSYFPVRGIDGEVTGAGAFVVDTTLRRELEAQLLQAQKMEAVGRLAGGVAHDFNNLLTVISSYSEMALETLMPDDPLYADMKEIRSSADRASRLTRQLLAFSRKQVMQPQVLDLNRVSIEMERMLRRLIGEDVSLSLDLARDLGEVRADPGQLEQVLMNLVLNARDATPDGGRLILGTANVTLASELAVKGVTVPPGDYVTLTVIDTGAGMTDDTKAHLFEPFFTTKPAGQGTGLGLATVYGIVKQSGGEIHVHSELGRGSTFIVYLPRLLRRSERTALPAALPASAPGGTETILLVEDDGALRTLAQRILKGAGYQVLEARSANAAIELGTSHPDVIHLLLTDVVMPQLSGRVVGARLSAMRPGLRVLYMSGYTDDDVLRRGVSATQTEFLQKPFTPEQLLRRIREVLDMRAPVSQRAG